MSRTLLTRFRDAASKSPFNSAPALIGTRWQSNISEPHYISNIAALLYALPDATQHEPRSLAVKGFVRSVRKQKNIAFLAIGDGSTFQPLQAVLSPEQAQGLSTGAAVSITGRWISSPKGKKQSHELQADEVKILGYHEPETFPLQKKYHSHDFLRKIPHLRSRSAFNSLLLRMRSQTISNTTKFFDSEDFINVHPPLITSSDCEGAGEVFTINPPDKQSGKASAEQFFREPKYLTVSSQLHLEALAASVGRVWTLSPTFRAERSDTPRHLSEFYMLEAEQMFTEDLESVMGVVERLLQSLASGLLSSRIGEELLEAVETKMHDASDAAISKQELQHRWTTLADGNWPRISYTEAIAHLQEATKNQADIFQYTPTWGHGLQAEHEKYIAKTIGHNGPVFVTDYPREIKAFYMPTDVSQASDTPKSGLTVSCFDLVVPELCEIVGGSLREYQMDPLLKSMADHGIIKGATDQMHQEDLTNNENETKTTVSSVPQSLQWYVDLRRYGSVPHGGFGLGFDRLLCYLSGVSSVRDMVAFPRWHGRCDC